MSVYIIAASLRSLWDKISFRSRMESRDKAVVGWHEKEWQSPARDWSLRFEEFVYLSRREESESHGDVCVGAWGLGSARAETDWNNHLDASCPDNQELSAVLWGGIPTVAQKSRKRGLWCVLGSLRFQDSKWCVSGDERAFIDCHSSLNKLYMYSFLYCPFLLKNRFLSSPSRLNPFFSNTL